MSQKSHGSASEVKNSGARAPEHSGEEYCPEKKNREECDVRERRANQHPALFYTKCTAASTGRNHDAQMALLSHTHGVASVCGAKTKPGEHDACGEHAYVASEAHTREWG